MEGSPLVTIVLPTCQRAALLQRALDCVRAQTFGKFRVMVLDDFSEDSTPEIVRAIQVRDPRVEYRRRERRVGGVESCREGFAAVETRYFAYLADDDAWTADFLEHAVAALERLPDAAFYACRSVVIDEAGRPFALSGPRSSGLQAAVAGARVIWDEGWPQQSGVLYRTAACREAGPIADLLGFDLEYLTRLSLRHPIVLDPQPRSFFTVNSRSASSSRGARLILDEWREFGRSLERVEDERHRGPLLASWRARLPGQVRMMTMHSLCQGDIVDACSGAAWLKREASGAWTTPIIRMAVAFAGIGRLPSALVQLLFRMRHRAFFLARLAAFRLTGSVAALPVGDIR